MNKTILVTGCSSGFGRLIATTLARAGHTVIATMRRLQDKNAGAAAELQQFADANQLSLHLTELDVTDDRSIERALAFALDQTSHLDVVVNNAGIMGIGVNESFTIDEVRTIFETNVFGPFRLNKAVLPHMRQQGSGLLIQISSVAGRVLFPFSGIYGASKSAVEALAESFHHDLALMGIESIIVEPGAYPTETANNALQPADGHLFDAYRPLHPAFDSFTGTFARLFSGSEIPDPQEVADAVKALIDMPAGQRPLRTVVGRDQEGVARLNREAAAVQADTLRYFGTSELSGNSEQDENQDAPENRKQNPGKKS